METTFAIDIDGTIAGRNMQHFARLCTASMELGIAMERIESLSYKAFMQSPEITAYRQGRGEQCFNAEIKEIEDEMQCDPVALRSLPVLPLACDGVQRLSGIGAIHYYTVRSDSPDIQDATRAWLHNNGFPSPDSVVFCKSVDAKLIGMYKLVRETQGRVVLIDDMWARLLEVYQQIKEGQHPRFSSTQSAAIAQALQHHLTLVAFSASSLENFSNLQVMALPAWKNVDDLIARLSRKELSLWS